jgi:hypothetical protein
MWLKNSSKKPKLRESYRTYIAETICANILLVIIGTIGL